MRGQSKTPAAEPEALEFNGLDVPMGRLVVLNERTINFDTNAGFRKICASIEAIGLIEPLSVYPEGERFVILDGYLRYMACMRLGVASVPCIIYKDKQAYTYNRNVNRLSAYQEIRMLRKSLESIDEPTIARTFGMKSIRSRLIPNVLRQLHSAAMEAFKENLLSKQAALEMTRVAHERQVEILAEMARMKDYSSTFCRALVIQTPAAQRNRGRNHRRAWKEDDPRRQDMMARLSHAEQQHDFYSQLYRQYSADLLKATFYVRRIISQPAIEACLAERHPEVLERFRAVLEAAG